MRNIDINNRFAGFSMIEILVAILVVTLGLFAAAGMHLTALRSTQQASLRSVAVGLAYDMADRIRSNGSAQLPIYLAMNGATNLNCYKAPTGAAAACTRQQIAQNDLAEWLKNVQNNIYLPGGKFWICRDNNANQGTPFVPNCHNAANDPVVIKIWWTEKDSTDLTSGVLPGYGRPGLITVIGM